MIGDPQLDTDSYSEDDDQLKRQGLPRIGRPDNSGLPPLVLRGVTPQAPAEPPVQAAQPSDTALASRKDLDEAELNRLQTSGSGITQIGRKNKVAGGILRGLDVLGSVVAPGIAANIPGTELHHNALLKRQRGLLGQDVEQQGKQAQAGEAAARTKQAEADANKAQAEADAMGQPKPKEEEWTVIPGMVGPNGQLVQQEKNSGQIRFAPGIEGVGPAKETAPKATKEQLQAKIVEAENRGDTATVKKLQQQMKDIDPEGQQRIVVQTGNQGTARGDKSYQLQSGRLDKMRQPVDQLIQRTGRLVETLNQKSPQADALVAPELLTIMAGGSGSGLRMNEAEIARIVGGRSVWEDLKAAAQQWSTDPEKARSITPDQDKAIRSLISAVHEKLVRKQKVLDDAEEGLLSSDDPAEHRRLVSEARKNLDAVDSVSAENIEGGAAKPPAGATMKVPGSDNKLHWSDGKKDLGVAE